MKNSKINKILLLTIVLSIVFTMTANAIVFTDISSHWAKNYIERVAENGLVAGYDDKTFKPDNNVNVLEALIMMSRLYDIDDEIKEEIIEKHESAVKSMINTKYYEWSFDYLSLVIELGIVSENGMRDMFSKKTIFQDATREEIAVLLTKAMMLDLKKAFVLPFKDASKINEAAKPYVYALYDKEILLGDNKNNFNPTNKITRAEIATLMDKAYNYIEKNDVYPDLDNYVPTTKVEGVITKLSSQKAESYIYIKSNNEVERIIKVNNETKVFVNGRARSFSDLKEDMIITSKIDENNVALEIEADSTKKVMRGTIYSVAFSAPASITINDEDDDRVKYDVLSDADVYHDGKETRLRDLKKNDEVTLFIDDDEVYQINSVSRIKHFDGKITAIDYTSFPIKITMKTEDGVVKTFEFNSDVEITRNDDKSTFDRVRVGDEVTITTSYDEMIRINTVAKEAEMSGVIREITLGTVNKIKVADKDGVVEEYSVSKNAVITIGNRNASINDLRVGYNIDVNTSGDEILTIEAAEIQIATNFTGKIIFINKVDNLIMMQNKNSNGQTELIYLKITNNTKMFNLSGETKYFKDMVEGQIVLSTAISQGGEYVAVSIMIQ